MIACFFQCFALLFCIVMGLRSHDIHFQFFCLIAGFVFYTSLEVTSCVMRRKEAESYFPTHNDFTKDDWNA